jgi:hypothetical protein
MSIPPTDREVRRNERQLKRALRHKNASPFVLTIKERLDEDLPRRLEVFASGSPEKWTGILALARTELEHKGLRNPAARPCDYTPWTKALAAVGAHPVDLMSFSDTVGRPPWPDNCQNLISFALTFLETDPMLFRSGYVKRHLLDRLRQQRLSVDAVERLTVILKLAVLNGTGLEEFRACCRIAAAHRPPGLEDWLRPLAARAKLDRGRHLDHTDRKRLPESYGGRGYSGPFRLTSYQPPVHAVPADLQGELVPMSPEDWADPDNQRAVNAWQMLRSLDRRNEGDRPRR